MQSQNRFFEDLAKVANGAAGTIAGMGREMEGGFRQMFERFIGGMDLIKRDEFEAVKEMAARARAEAEALKVRLDALENRSSAAPLSDMPGLDPNAREARKRKPGAPAA